MKIFKELKKLGYKHYTEHTVEELDDLPLNSEERIMEQALVLRWFREKHGLHYNMQVLDGKWFFERWSLDGFKTYEESELACLKKLIEIVKEK